MVSNTLCGLTEWHGQWHGTYTNEGVMRLCEGIKGSIITTLECAKATPVHSMCLARSIDLPTPMPSAQSCLQQNRRDGKSSPPRGIRGPSHQLAALIMLTTPLLLLYYPITPW